MDSRAHTEPRPILQDYQISFTGRFNIYDLLLDQPYFDSSYGAVSKEHMTLIKVR